MVNYLTLEVLGKYKCWQKKRTDYYKHYLTGSTIYKYRSLDQFMGRLHLSLYVHVCGGNLRLPPAHRRQRDLLPSRQQHALKITGWQAAQSSKHLLSIVHAHVMNQLRKTSPSPNLNRFSCHVHLNKCCFCMCWLLSLVKFSTECALNHVCHPSHCWIHPAWKF